METKIYNSINPIYTPYQYPTDASNSFLPTPIPTSFHQPLNIYQPKLNSSLPERSSEDSLFDSPKSDNENDAVSNENNHNYLDSPNSTVLPSQCNHLTPPHVSDTDSGNSSGFASDNSPVAESKIRKSGSPDQSIVKKNTRTNYSPQQIRTLEKIFLETPYPESEVMEQLSRDMNIPEKNLKIWFQNKRARWRKRVRDNKPAFPPLNQGHPLPLATKVPQYSMMSPSALISPVSSPQIMTRPMYNIPYTMPSTPNLSSVMPGSSQFNTSAMPYWYPQYK